MRDVPAVAVSARLFLASALSLVAACGAGGGTSTFLPPGEPTTAPPGDDVLYMSLSSGDRVVAYRLGTDGLLPRDPFSEIALRNPRDIVLDGDILYVALEDRVVALEIEPDGGLPSLPSSQTSPIEDAEATDLLLGDGVLYVAFEELARIHAYALESGQLTPNPISVSGTSLSDYRALALGEGFVYAASPTGAQIDTYKIQPDGSLLPSPDPQDPETEIFRVEGMLVRDGVLYAAHQSRDRIEAFVIRPNGLLPDEFTSRTAAEQRYARLLIDGEVLYATGFNLGRVDAYRLESDGSLPRTAPFAETAHDAAAFPISMVVANGVLYVAQSGLGRIDAYILGGDGEPSVFPSSSTDAISGSFPVGLALGAFPVAGG